MWPVSLIHSLIHSVVHYARAGAFLFLLHNSVLTTTQMLIPAVIQLERPFNLKVIRGSPENLFVSMSLLQEIKKKDKPYRIGSVMYLNVKCSSHSEYVYQTTAIDKQGNKEADLEWEVLAPVMLAPSRPRIILVLYRDT